MSARHPTFAPNQFIFTAEKLLWRNFHFITASSPTNHTQKNAYKRHIIGLGSEASRAEYESQQPDHCRNTSNHNQKYTGRVRLALGKRVLTNERFIGFCKTFNLEFLIDTRDHYRNLVFFIGNFFHKLTPKKRTGRYKHQYICET